MCIDESETPLSALESMFLCVKNERANFYFFLPTNRITEPVPL